MEKKSLTKLHWLYFSIIVCVMVVVDQLTKWLATLYLKNSEGVVWIKGVFELQYHENRGAAFSSMQGKGVLLVCGTIVILALVLYSYHKIPRETRYVPLRVIFAMLTAGAIGNMVDRIMNGYVVDFLYFSLINFPIFNIADCYVTVSVILFAIYAFFIYKEDELDFLFTLKKKKVENESSDE